MEKLNGKTMSLNQEAEINMALPEQHPKRWKSRLQRFQSTLRQSMRLKKGYSPRSASVVNEEQRIDLEKEKENHGAKRSAKHVRRENLAKEQHNTVSQKQDNGTKTNSHLQYLSRKTSFDKSSLDKGKFEKIKTNGNNNRKEKKTTAESSSSNAHVNELADRGQNASNSGKRTQRSKRQRANTNTEAKPLTKSKSLSILTNLFRRSNQSKDKNNRGKSSSQTAVSNELSTGHSTNVDTLVTDIAESTSSLDSYGDCDSQFKRNRYYSLKRSKGSLIFPKTNLPRSFSLDNSLDPCNPPMAEKSKTLAAIPPCIRVEEYRENCRGVFERALTVEFVPGSCGSVANDTRPEYYQTVTGCAHAVGETLGGEVDPLPRVGNRRNETGPNITPRAAKNNDAQKRRSAPPSSQYSADKKSSNIVSPISRELKTDIAPCDGNYDQIEQNSEGGQSNFLEERKLPLENIDCKDCGDLESDMGNNASYGQKPRKFNPRDATFKMEFLRSFKKNGKSFYRNATDGEADPIIEESDFLEGYDDWELENGVFNYNPAKGNSANNGQTKDKSNSLYEGTEALEHGKRMIDTFQKNNHAQDFLVVRSTIDEITDAERQSKENQNTEGKLAGGSTESLSNDKVNNGEQVCEEHFCSTNCGQTEQDGSTHELSECLSCVKTRCELTDSQSVSCSPQLSESPLGDTNAGGLNIQSLRDHISAELITFRLGEICSGRQGLAGKGVQSFRVNSLPSSPRPSFLSAVATIPTMYHSFPDIRKLHTSHVLPLNQLSDSTDSINSTCSLNVENGFENNDSTVDNSGEKAPSPLSLSLNIEKCRKHGVILKSHLSPYSPVERGRSSSARIPLKSPVHRVLLTENRSVSCSQLDKNNDSPTCTSPPYVRPRMQSLEELPPCTAEVVLRKKKSIIRKNRMKHTASLSCVDNVLNEMIDKGKRHSYGGYCDKLFLQLPHQLLQRSHSSESCDSFNSSQQSVNSSSSFTENELGSTFSVASELSFPGNFDVSLNRSRSVPGYLGGIHQTSPIPEERASVSEMDWPSPSEVNNGDENEDDDEMDVPEAFAEALWDHVTMDPEELSFQAGDIITVLTMTSCDWWFGQVGDRVGWFPAPFVRVRVSQTLAADETKLGPPVRTRKGTNEGFLSDTVVRSRVVLEILSTERDYVKNLEDVVEGYLKQARKRTDMFTEEKITKIFSNIEQIYEFHQEILRQLEDCFVEEDPCASEIGSVFLNNKKGFEIYSEYCNNHPHAMAELKTLCESNKYKQFFEACRLLQDMISISLDGFLLTPVQKICKYPLQLAELKKHTRPTHKDFQTVTRASETMKNVASLINERKRKVESINKIAKWQSTIEGWEGEDVLERSSELIHSGDVIKTSNGSSQDRVMFLFDHQLVYCKKDILKKNGLTYKGRIDMDDCTVIWLRDGEETLDRSPLNNAWKIYNFKKEKWYIFYTKKAAHKEKWMKAFKDERRRVREDAKTGLIISQNTKKAAMRAAKASVKNKKVNGKKEKPPLRSQSTAEIKPPPSPTLRLPAPVSSADLREEEEDKDMTDSPLGARSSVIRRSFGLRGSKNKNKEKRKSSMF